MFKIPAFSKGLHDGGQVDRYEEQYGVLLGFFGWPCHVVGYQKSAKTNRSSCIRSTDAERAGYGSGDRSLIDRLRTQRKHEVHVRFGERHRDQWLEKGENAGRENGLEIQCSLRPGPFRRSQQLQSEDLPDHRRLHGSCLGGRYYG